MAIVAKLLPRWPAAVNGVSPIVSTKANGAVTLSYDSSGLPTTGSVSATAKILTRDGAVYQEVLATAVSFPTISDQRLLGNVSGGTAAASALTGTQANGVLPAFTGDSGSGGAKGLVPAPSAGDAAAGRFLAASGTFSAPTFTQSGTGAVSRLVTAKLGDIVSVKDFGAIGDDSTDDTAALNLFFAAVAAGAKGVITQGTYRFTSALNAVTGSNLWVVGDGARSILKYTGGSTTPGDLLTFGNGTTTYDVLTLRDFVIGSGTTLTGGYGLRIKDYTNVKIDMALNGGGNLYKGLRLEGCSYVDMGITQIYSRNSAVEINDGVEINMQNSELLAAVPGTGDAVLLGGGVGGWYGQNCASLFFNVGVRVDTSLARQKIYTGNTTNLSGVITNLSSTVGLRAGQTVSGTNIPTTARIVSVDSSTQVTITPAATGNGVGTSITFYSGNTQLMFGSSVWDSSASAALYLNDSTYVPSGKICCLDNAWFTSTTAGNGISVVNWNIGTISGPGPVIRSNSGYGINISDTTVRLQLSSGADIGWNTAGGINSSGAITIYSTARQHDNSGADLSSNITVSNVFSNSVQIVQDPTTGWLIDGTANTVTIANGANAAVSAGSGMFVVANNANGDIGIYIAGGGSVVLVASTASTWVAPTTTPAAGRASLAWSGAEYRIYNNYGSSQAFIIAPLMKLRPTV
jgi:hypothetical protein